MSKCLDKVKTTSEIVVLALYLELDIFYFEPNRCPVVTPFWRYFDMFL